MLHRKFQSRIGVSKVPIKFFTRVFWHSNQSRIKIYGKAWLINMSDYIVRATAANAQIRAFACSTRDIVEEARKMTADTAQSIMNMVNELSDQVVVILCDARPYMKDLLDEYPMMNRYFPFDIAMK